MPVIEHIELVHVVNGYVVVHMDCVIRCRRADDQLRSLRLTGPAVRQLHAKLGALLADPAQRATLESMGAL